MNSDIPELNNKRFQFLNFIYKKIGDDELASIHYSVIINELQITSDEFHRISHFLLGEGLIDFPCHGEVGITHLGIVTIENWISDLGKPADYSPQLNTIQVNHFENSQIIQEQFDSSNNSSSRLSILISELESLEKPQFPEDPYVNFSSWSAKALPIIHSEWPDNFDQFSLLIEPNQWNGIGIANFSGEKITRDIWEEVIREVIVQQNKVLQFLNGLALLPAKSQDSSKFAQKTVNINLGNNSNVDNLIVSDLISQSFNRIQNFNSSEEIKQSLVNLSSQIKELSKQIPEEISQDLVKDLDSITKELSSNKPRKEWIKLSIDDLIKAAQNIGEIAKPVLTIAYTLLKILQL